LEIHVVALPMLFQLVDVVRGKTTYKLRCVFPLPIYMMRVEIGLELAEGTGLATRAWLGLEPELTRQVRYGVRELFAFVTALS
jgi:hypothetical protein